MKRHGKWLRTMGENIAYGPKSGRDIVASLLIDDGVPGRGHRHNIMNEKFGVVGIKIEKHPKYGFVCVMDFAGDFTDK